MRGEEVEKQKVMATPGHSSLLTFPGQDGQVKTMVKVILALRNSVAIIWTRDLFLLWTGLKHSRAGLAGITDCLLPSS